MNVAQMLERSAFYFPEQTALVFKDRRWTYRELDRDVSALASGLKGLGLKPGERVGLHLPNWPEFVLTYYAAQKIGVVPLSLNVTYKADEIAYICRDGEVAGVVTADAVAANLPSRDDLPSVRQVIRIGAPAEGTVAFAGLTGDPTLRALDLDREETAAILYTSATTGRPKGVMLTHANVVSNAFATCHHLRMTPADRGLCALPLFHCFGQNFILNALVNSGGTLVLQERFVLEEFLAAIGRERVTLLYAVPTMYILTLAGDTRPYDFSSLRLCFSAAAMLPADVERRWHERYGHWIHQGYGLTECSPFASYNHDTLFRPGSVGTPIENVEMKVVNEQERELPDGELGEIVIKGPNVMTGYFRNPEATAQAVKNGWLHSGDIGYRDAEGYYYVVDRVKDMINVSGFKVFPREVEEILFRHPAVKEAAVLGIPDPVRGEAVKAFVVLKEGERVDPETLQRLCREKIASYKVPEAIEFLPALPKSPTGKILKKDLRVRR
ncbi:MAG: long-chain fatty acid--CoA ligase [Candidatus Rokubacteria bacterium]|nr:long-chain fatty acid--CoA ligase [Candidatus Rokubacteria bacterium]